MYEQAKGKTSAESHSMEMYLNAVCRVITIITVVAETRRTCIHMITLVCLWLYFQDPFLTMQLYIEDIYYVWSNDGEAHCTVVCV